jgi:hypothetical protein
LSGCTPRPSAVVIPDSQDLRQACTCSIDGKQGGDPDMNRVTMDLGYARTILRTFEECRQ